MTIEATETDLTADKVPECELWDIEEFERYKVRLINNGGIGEIVDFGEWKKRKVDNEIPISSDGIIVLCVGFILRNRGVF